MGAYAGSLHSAAGPLGDWVGLFVEQSVCGPPALGKQFQAVSEQTGELSGLSLQPAGRIEASLGQAARESGTQGCSVTCCYHLSSSGHHHAALSRSDVR